MMPAPLPSDWLRRAATPWVLPFLRPRMVSARVEFRCTTFPEEVALPSLLQLVNPWPPAPSGSVTRGQVVGARPSASSAHPHSSTFFGSPVQTRLLARVEARLLGAPVGL